MADTRLIPPGIDDERARILAQLMDGPGTLNLVPLLVNHFDSVPASALPHLIEQYALTEFTSDDMPDVAVRRLLKRGLLLHRFRGSRFAVEEALSVAGIRAQIVEWHEHGGTGQPYTFRVTAFVKENLDANTGQPVLNDKTLSRAIRLINASKRASVTYDLILAVEFSGALCLGGALSPSSHMGAKMAGTPRPADLAVGLMAAGAVSPHHHFGAQMPTAPRPAKMNVMLKAGTALTAHTTIFATMETTAR